MYDIQFEYRLGEWKIENVGLAKYEEFSQHMSNVFNKGQFLSLNDYKVQRVHYLVISKGNSARFAFSLGIDDNVIVAPFSASYCYPEILKKGQSIENYEIAVRLINRYIDGCDINRASITFPPSYYDEGVISTWVYLFHLHGWKISHIDIDYAFNINEMCDYESIIAHNAKKNLHISLKKGLYFSKCKSEGDYSLAYDIIKQNRNGKGYELKMSKEQVMETVKHVPSDMYLVREGERGIASALVYEVAPLIGLVVYWGDVPGISNLKVMNYLPFMLIKEYESRGFKYLDIGSSTLKGRPNYGLCSYKESIGCSSYDMFTIEKSF